MWDVGIFFNHSWQWSSWIQLNPHRIQLEVLLIVTERRLAHAWLSYWNQWGLRWAHQNKVAAFEITSANIIGPLWSRLNYCSYFSSFLSWQRRTDKFLHLGVFEIMYDCRCLEYLNMGCVSMGGGRGGEEQKAQLLCSWESFKAVSTFLTYLNQSRNLKQRQKFLIANTLSPWGTCGIFAHQPKYFTGMGKKMLCHKRPSLRSNPCCVLVRAALLLVGHSADTVGCFAIGAWRSRYWNLCDFVWLILGLLGVPFLGWYPFLVAKDRSVWMSRLLNLKLWRS